MRKVLYIIIATSFLAFGSAIAQDHQTTQLENGSKILDAVNVNTGLVLLTGKEYYLTHKLDWKIRYYTPHMTARYAIEVPKPSIGSLDRSFLVTSPSGNNVYFISHGPGGWFGASKNTQKILHIDSIGISNSLLVKHELEYKRVNVVFADDDYLYYVTKEKDKTTRNKHAFPKLQFVRIGKDKSVSKLMLALPDPDPDGTEWSYLGHTTVVSYFVSRIFDDENKKQTLRVAVIDHDGKLQDDFKIEVPLKDGVFLPQFNYCGTQGTKEVDNHNIQIVVTSNTTYYSNGASNTTTSTSYYPYPEAFGNIMLDPFSNGFYVYGIMGANKEIASTGKKHRKGGIHELSGYYVYKFDQDGKQLWAYENKLTGLDDHFKTASFYERYVKLSYGQQGNLRFQAFNKKNAVTYEINPQTGKFASAYTNEFQDDVTINDLGTCHKSGDKTDLGKFLSKPDKGDYSQLNFRMANNNFIIRNFYKDGKLDLYSFVDE